jgi:hypothetical protein
MFRNWYIHNQRVHQIVLYKTHTIIFRSLKLDLLRTGLSKEANEFNEFNAETELLQGESQKQGAILCWILTSYMTLHKRADEN